MSFDVAAARNRSEVQQFIKLAASIFRSTETAPEGQSVKSALFSRHRRMSLVNIIVIKNNSNLVGGCCLIDRRFYWNTKIIRGTFISSVCVDKGARAQGASVLLVEAALKQCQVRETDFALVIARRLVDNYYTKFGFTGVSQYSKVLINLSDTRASCSKKFIRIGTEKDFQQCSYAYKATYSGLLGSCVRSKTDWKHIYWKLSLLNLHLLVFSSCSSEQIHAYAILRNQDIIEIAGHPSIPLLPVVRCIGKHLGAPSLVLHIPPQHRLISELESIDFTVSLRQCSYGGHMVKVINHARFKVTPQQTISPQSSLLELPLTKDMRSFHAPWATRMIKKTSIFADTCNTMGIRGMSLEDSLNGLPKSFNIPLVDQV